MKWRRKKKMWDLFQVNRTGINQILSYKRASGSVSVAPESFVDVSLLNGGYHGVLTKLKHSFLKEMQETQTQRFYLERTFSLGDTLMLVPIVRRLRELGYDPYVRTLPQYREILELLGVEVDTNLKMKRTPGIMLDFVVEKDHYDKEVQVMPRIEIYSRAVGLSLNYNEDWSMDRDRFPEAPVKFDNYIVFQGMGNTEKRGLPLHVIQDILYFLNLEEINTVYIGAKKDLDGDDKFTDFKFMDQTIPELFSIIHGAKLVISMDSSPIWVSHFTRTPLTAILGPSRPDERLIHHPLFRTDVRALRLNEWIKCKPCFEQALACENKVTCFTSVKAEDVYKALRPTIQKYWEK